MAESCYTHIHHTHKHTQIQIHMDRHTYIDTTYTQIPHTDTQIYTHRHTKTQAHTDTHTYTYIQLLLTLHCLWSCPLP